MQADAKAGAAPESATNGRLDGATPQPSASDPWLEDLGAVGLESLRWLSLRAERARVRMRRHVLELVAASPLVVFGMTVAALAGLEFARGVSGAWKALFAARPWLGQIAAGATLLALLVLALHLWVRASEQREIRRLKEKLEDDGPIPDPGAPDA